VLCTPIIDDHCQRVHLSILTPHCRISMLRVFDGNGNGNMASSPPQMSRKQWQKNYSLALFQFTYINNLMGPFSP
jgi:hypothetical protein